MRDVANLEVLLDAMLTEDVPEGMERGKPAGQAAADRAHEVVGDAIVQPHLVETLLEGRSIDLDACQAVREARCRVFEGCACDAARMWRIHT